MLQEKPPYTSKALEELVMSPISPRKPLIENLLYEKSVMMIYADPGVGKSVLSLCMALQASAGLPVFNFFDCARPLKVYYVLTERGIEEPLERIQMMRRAIDINYENLYIDQELIGYNVLNAEEELKLTHRIEKYCAKPDIIVFDPIYSMVRGGLSDPDDATLFAQFSARIQHHFGCASWFTHHTLKNSYDLVEGHRVAKSDPFFGSQLLKAHVTAMYHMTQHDGKVLLDQKKDSHQILLKKLSLVFDAESQTLAFERRTSDLPAKDRADIFFKQCKKAGKMFTFDEFVEALKPSGYRWDENLISVALKDGLILNTKPKFTKALYTVL